MAVPVQAGGGDLQFDTPVRLIERGYAFGGQPPTFDVAPDGRFLLLEPGDDRSSERPITIVQLAGRASTSGDGQ
jgi:hypothetical protein